MSDGDYHCDDLPNETNEGYERTHHRNESKYLQDARSRANPVVLTICHQLQSVSGVFRMVVPMTKLRTAHKAQAIMTVNRLTIMTPTLPDNPPMPPAMATMTTTRSACIVALWSASTSSYVCGSSRIAPMNRSGNCSRSRSSINALSAYEVSPK